MVHKREGDFTLKRVLIIGMTSTVGGVETFLMTLHNNIDKSKFQFDFLVREDIEGIYREKILDNGGKIHAIGSIRKSPFKTISNLFEFYREHQDYDVIHINAGRSTMIIYMLPILFKRNKRVIAHSHNGSDIGKLLHYIFRPIQNFIATDYVACSKVAGEWMFGKKIANSDKLTIINNAINTKKFLFDQSVRDKIRAELQLEDKFVVGHVGRFWEQKNHRFLIDIFAEILKINSKAVLMLVGDGSLSEEIEQKVKDLGISDNVKFMGICNNTNELFQAMDVFLLPSLFEGLPIVGIEAQASGLKCFFSDTITKEANITGNIQYIKLNDSAESWAREIINNGSRYTRENMYEKIAKAGFDIDTEIKKIEKIYSE